MSKLLLKVFTLIIVLLAWSANAETPSFGLTEKLQQPAGAIEFLNKKLILKNNIQGDFSQEKHIKVLSRPLKSTGKFVLNEVDGLIWDTQLPTQSRIKVNATGLYEWKGGSSSDKEGWQIKPESQSAGFSRYAKSFQALLNADIKQLQLSFELYWQRSEKDWRLGLKPKQNSPLNKLIHWIRVSGSDRVNMIQIQEQSGDFSQITLLNIANLNKKYTGSTAK